MKILKIATLIFLLFRHSNVYSDDVLPAFSFIDTDGKMHDVSEWQGKKLVINFWATWCQPCLKEIPEFVQLQTQYTKQNVQFIGIAIDELPAVTRYKNTLAMNYPVLISNEWDGFNLAQQLGNSANTVPYTVVVNATGQIIYRHAGAVKKEDLIAVLGK
ncbi:MAG: TlpA disulfide reductase family protein [Methylococcales bacterium]|nr:TlpA disulfide reductase family protein [Methylococcales bacterium]MDD5753702.1 TlpA disulfide reductase family protein [Methylococcales bacterium]